MNEWKKVKFLDYIELNPKVSIAKGEVCPFIEMANVDCNMRQPRCFEYKPFTSGVKFQTYDTVIARIEPCLQNGKGFLFTKQGVGFGSTEYLVFRAKPSKTIPLFVYYFMRTHKIKTLMCNSMSGATGRQRVNNDVFLNLEVDIPSYDEQQRIATILSRYDSLIENYQKQIKLLEESAQRLYKEWFIDLRFPGHENTKIVDGVPEGWEKKIIKDLVDLKSGYAFKSSAFVGEGKYKIVTIKNVKDGVFDRDNVSYLNTLPEKMPSHCLLKTGDILLSLTGNVGRVCMVIGDNYLLNQRVAKLESNFPAFTYCHFRYYDTFVAINNLANGAAQQNVSPIRIGEMYMLVANDMIMCHFEKMTHNIRTNILNLFSQIHQLTEARYRLLPKLMSGEIKV